MAANTLQLYRQRNEEIKAWGRRNRSLLKSSQKSAGINKYTGALGRYVQDKYRSRFNKIDMVGFRMPRHGVFVEKGVGRGHPISSVGAKLGRKAKPWFNPVLDAQVPKLANIAAKHGADIIAKTIFIR